MLKAQPPLPSRPDKYRPGVGLEECGRQQHLLGKPAPATRAAALVAEKKLHDQRKIAVDRRPSNRIFSVRRLKTAKDKIISLYNYPSNSRIRLASAWQHSPQLS